MSPFSFFILWNADSGGIVQWLNKVMFEVVIQTALRLEEVFSVLKNVDVLLDSPVCSEAWRARKRAQSTRKTRDMSCLPMPFITNTASKASSESIPSRVSWFTPPPIAPLPRPQSAFDKDFQGECFGRMAATTSVDLSSSTRAPMVTSTQRAPLPSSYISNMWIFLGVDLDLRTVSLWMIFDS